MKRKQSLYLSDIKNAIESIISFTQGMSFEEFESDDRTFSAVIRKLDEKGFYDITWNLRQWEYKNKWEKSAEN